MKGIIILEGPDGAGKSYFASILANKYNGIILHQKYKFKNKIDLYYMAVFKKALDISKNKLVILDRFHISEIIYGEVFRNGSKFPWILKYYKEIFNSLGAITILCIPKDIKQGEEWFKQVKAIRSEMYPNITKIIEKYINYSISNPNILTYNKDDAQNTKGYIEEIIKKIEGKLCTN